MRLKIEGKGIEELLGRLRKANEPNQVRRGLKVQMFRAMTILQVAIIANILRKLKRRSGNLLKSIPAGVEVSDTPKGVTGFIGPVGIPYAAINEYGSEELLGGPIRPKKAGGWLAVPLPPALGPDMLPRVSPNELVNAFFYTSKRGNLLLATAEGGDLVNYFVMKKEITIPERSYLRPAMERSRQKIMDNFGLFIRGTYLGKGSE